MLNIHTLRICDTYRFSTTALVTSLMMMVSAMETRPNVVKVKVKLTPVQALRLCTGRTAHRGSKCIVLPFHDHGTRRGWGVSVTPRPLFTQGKDPVPIVQEALAPGPVWTGAENLAPTGIGYPDRPARSQSLYRLRYAAHGKAVIFTYSECLSVALVIRHAKRVRHVICSLPICTTVFTFPHVKGTIFGKKFTECKAFVLIFSTTAAWNISLSEKNPAR